MKRLAILLSFILTPLVLFSQEQPGEADTLRKSALNVYFPDVPTFIRKEINFINYVRDLKEADIYLIVSFEDTGSGGSVITVFITGQNKFEGMNDTLKLSISPDDTEEVFMNKATTILKMGLMRYILKTPLAEFFNIQFTVPVKETVETDRWNNWVFRAGFNTNVNGEKRYQSENLNGNISANRITEESKFTSYLAASWSRQKYELNDSTTEYNYTRSQRLNIYYAKSLNDHWSAGFSTGVSASSYGYYDLQYRITPAIEYDIYPYSESTRRQFRIMYEIGYLYNNYSDTTIYDKVKEHLGVHNFTAAWELIQKWGSIDLQVSWRNYFHDWTKNNLSASLYMSVRIFKGLNINFSGSASIVNDQLSLPKAGISDLDIIMRRRMTETKFDYYGSFGFSYTFGSIYNNAVNPRFGW